MNLVQQTQSVIKLQFFFPVFLHTFYTESMHPASYISENFLQAHCHLDSTCSPVLIILYVPSLYSLPPCQVIQDQLQPRSCPTPVPSFLTTPVIVFNPPLMFVLLQSCLSPSYSPALLHTLPLILPPFLYPFYPSLLQAVFSRFLSIPALLFLPSS